ncbi:unnamed protein product (macronuclear) [Paramecium tetraurelia]|uniref:EF-hand domain-containing protein n=1 Tax=Paramecium tetraurelia TaxID=5888 RepID=A0DQE8_PARTE|nr:uncharacterized protein GSPATT00002665001 [Paramecium tetraurelia]CAK85265.1 unnamed protein product [Paramecium tetraurelia]|eukprot:XP_001452662.1 hypothetical protein (macronuclear) [Paramecium tetraurelia strain d4-2]
MNSTNAVLEKTSRTQMQTNDVNSWLRRRHFNKVKQQYLLHPDQIKQEQVIKKIFINFDRDKSKNIDISEMYDMFQKYGFGVTEKQLKDFFRVVDKDKDNALNWDEFKNSVIDADASKIFYNIIKEVRQNSNVESSSNFGYIPFQFNDMISYLNYLISRNELQESIKQNSLTTYERFQQYLQLIQLNQPQNQNYNYQQHNRINEEMKEQTQDELEFTKINSNKFTYSKTSFYNTNDLPLLLKLKSNKKQNVQKDHNMRTSIDSQQTYLSNQFSLQTNPKSDRYISQKMVNNHILILNTSSQHKMPPSDKYNKSQNIDSNVKSTPYLQLNINKINSSYREHFQTEPNNNNKQDSKNKIDHLPITLINELQKFQILSGNHKRRHTNFIKTSQNKQGDVNPKKITSLLKTSADFNPHSPSNSKLCTPRFLRDEKCITYRKTTNRPIFQTYSQYNKSEKPLCVTLKGKSLQIK